ncbi:APC family permease [Yokenella regensburgei]|uniref:APC family permease n=1 Tax=Yokenella regensburgei TaxID=158877 RepID=UPI0014334121|nr:APC family permease [Yokenella regensburgei]QIU88499.1 APC family permease [Yokenella regensburgei]
MSSDDVVALQTAPATQEKGLRMRDLILGIICSVFFIDTVAPISAMGVSSLAWMVIIGLLFFFPGCLVVAELGSTYPENGGFYAWIKRAYGPLWGARIVWIYWAGNAIWISSAITLVVNVFCSIMHLHLSMSSQAIMNVGVIWLVVLFAMRPVNNTTGLVNFAAIAKIMMAIALLATGFIYLSQGNAPKNSFSWQELTPSYGEAMIFIPALIYNFLGFEIMSASGGAIKNPARDVPIASLINVLLVIVLNIIAVAGVLIVVPSKDVNIIEGVVDAFRHGFGDGPIAHLFIYIIGSVYLLVLMAQALMWILGTSQVAVEAAKNKELPNVLSKVHAKNNSPIGALIIGGIISTVVVVFSTLASSSAQQMFWSIFACTSILLLVPYFVNFEAYLKLKKVDKNIKRPYVFPGPSWLVPVFVRIAQFIIACTILFFIWVPGQPVDVNKVTFIILGVCITLGIGEFLIRRSMKEIKRGSKK